ncbi:P-loop containing nucleoside triphosphate hydrolase protein [Armillaria novae-zelandiae]|uniref:P-loop containing nucleoside triphosphate hydrolase protein n=1 Tax=Armillaria novae-zelandiae TaxID=153914 RepID=A0AA39P1Y0_9AGAR|nr:P-loop containing nucleoside triphosphate hydrolase protein [Armillaria novae-zelandiae]
MGTIHGHVIHPASDRTPVSEKKSLCCSTYRIPLILHSFTLALVRIFRNASISTERVLVSTSSHRHTRGKTPLSAVHLRLRDFCSAPPCARRAYHAQAEVLVDKEEVSASCELEAGPAPRFDWRLRAVSRQKEKKRKHKRRIAPQQTVLQEHEPFYSTVHRYSNHFNGLLDAEIAAEEAAIHQRLSTWSRERLSEEGYCLTDMTAFWLEEEHFGRRTATFTRGPGVQLPETRFESGTQVLVSRIDPLKEEAAQGSLVSRTPLQLKVSFPEQVAFDAADLGGAWRLDLGHSSLVHLRMREAIGHLHRDVGEQEAVMAPDREEALNGTHLKDVILRGYDQGDMEGAGTGGVFSDNQVIYSWARRYMRPNPVVVEGDPVIDGLNATQVRAMAQMIGERFSLVQGPPGTGKTKTIIETIKLLKGYFQTPEPILVCTYTNVAVDNLVEGFVAAGVKPIRVAFGGKTRASLEPYTYEYKMQRHPLYPEAEKVSDAIKVLEGEVREAKQRAKELARKVNSGRTSLAQRLEGMLTAIAKKEEWIQAKKARWYALTQQMTKDVLGEADVQICTTCLTAASRVLEATDFPVVFLDEASMSTEPASLVPLMKGSRHVALIGDHKQLPPVIVSKIAKMNGLNRSLFERLILEGRVPSIMLDIQYRMHPAISAFPSLEFYGTSLLDGTVDSGGNILSRLAPPNSQHLTKDGNGNRPSVVFLDHAGAESSKDRSPGELERGSHCGERCGGLAADESGDDIGIIAPYAAQISLLTRLFRVNARYRQRFELVLGEHRALQIADIEIKTVDGFEGREKEIIIFSTVRNNAGGHIGFLGDRGRLNVGLTRAQRGLFIVGSISTLKMGRSVEEETGAVAWRNYARYLVAHGRVSRIGGTKLQQAIYGHLRAARRDPPLHDSGVLETRI